ncbi:MAG: methyltransferase domain-containing protein [Neomegalonema sp.]|nr:methyltransferase domain-containing protein [Neomegalonema sp.]
MVEISQKTFEQESWSARAGLWLDTAAHATALGAPRLLTALDVHADNTVLDLCCGPGVVAGAAYALGASATGIDFAPAMVAIARERVPEARFQIGDAEALDVRANEFHAVACNFGLQHVADPQQAMREAFRALKQGGRFGWTHWLAPEQNPVARACLDAIAKHGDPALESAEVARDAFRLADEDSAKAAMRRAGFREIQFEQLTLEFTAPREGLAALAYAMMGRAPLVLDRQPTDALTTINAAIQEALGGAGARISAPALLCVGVKPELTAPTRGRNFGIVKELLHRGRKEPTEES